MALPKRQHSKQRGRKRRTHWKITLPSLGLCGHCGKQVLPHRVCPFCGFYKDKQVVEIKIKDKKKAK
ncbi:MAG: 50S ribosomal protein L32 [Candidatus Omnitrophota bacterium]